MKHTNAAESLDSAAGGPPRHEWTAEDVAALFELPFPLLLDRARAAHLVHFPVPEMQISTLLSIKTGACPEDCAYCPQSVHFDTGLAPEKLMPLEAVVAAAETAKARGATRFCMGAAYRKPRPHEIARISQMISAVAALGLETCCTLGTLDADQARQLKDAGLDYYNHNLDTSERYYAEIITTRPFAERLETLAEVRAAGLKVCCGGIVGMGETREDRIELLRQLATLPSPPESVPINHLVRVPGTPLADAEPLDPIEFVRTVAVARVLMPASRIRLSAGRSALSDEAQALAFYAGANSIFYGEQLLTTPNPEADQDRALLGRLGITAEAAVGH
ncbi:MAG: biotin synthase BioB [Gammaproteobacteria bacterium]|nr:MAG: biotin synthase BioB [Gammaproteobacteria bacterium]